MADSLQTLLPDVPEERRHVAVRARQRLEQVAACITRSQSCGNLAHYLDLRHLDLRPLRDRLAAAGLSSLGRCEAHVFASLNNIGQCYRAPVNRADSHTQNLPFSTFEDGKKLLADYTRTLFGSDPHQRTARIMVTLPGDAAGDPGPGAGAAAAGNGLRAHQLTSCSVCKRTNTRKVRDCGPSIGERAH